MYKVIITWAGTEQEETNFDKKEDAENYIKDVVSPGSNIHACIVEE